MQNSLHTNVPKTELQLHTCMAISKQSTYKRTKNRASTTYMHGNNAKQSTYKRTKNRASTTYMHGNKQNSLHTNVSKTEL